jgi:hypothetical protein
MHVRARDRFKLAVVAVATLSGGCSLFTGPSKSVAGNWSASSVIGAGSVIDHFEMSLSQSGDVISGTACRATSSQGQGNVLEDIPVAGDYPHITFRVTRNGVTQSFSGKFEEDRDQIAGDFGTMPLRFGRASSGHCEGAKPLP